MDNTRLLECRRLTDGKKRLRIPDPGMKYKDRRKWLEGEKIASDLKA